MHSIHDSETIRSTGLGIVDCLLALALLLLVLPSVLTFLTSVQQQTAANNAEMEMEENLRAVLNRVTLLVQQAGYNPYQIALTPIHILNNTGVYVESDVNDGLDGPADGALGGTYEQVLIEWDAAAKQVVQRSGKGTRQPLAGDIFLFEVHGIDRRGDVTINDEDIFWVDIQLKAERTNPLFGKRPVQTLDWSLRIPVFSRLEGR